MGDASDHRPCALVVDDEPEIVAFVELGLRDEGWTVVSAADAATAVNLVRSAQPDLVLLDVGLPGVDGFETLRRIRIDSRVPVIMLTARGDLDDRVRGLDLGADDYVAKPFHLEEVLARARAQLRRTAGQPAGDDILRFADLTVDPRTRDVARAGVPIALTVREYELLVLLLQHPRQVFSKETILDRLWGYAFDDNLVEVYVAHLRRKLGEPQLIQTLRGAGYSLRETAGEA